MLQYEGQSIQFLFELYAVGLQFTQIKYIIDKAHHMFKTNFRIFSLSFLCSKNSFQQGG